MPIRPVNTVTDCLIKCLNKLIILRLLSSKIETPRLFNLIFRPPMQVARSAVMHHFLWLCVKILLAGIDPLVISKFANKQARFFLTSVYTQSQSGYVPTWLSNFENYNINCVSIANITIFLTTWTSYDLLFYIQYRFSPQLHVHQEIDLIFHM